MMREPVGVVMIGLGRWSRQLAAAARRADSLDVLTCYSRTPEKRHAFAAEFGTQEARTLEEALTTPGVQGAILATPGYTHLELAQACAAHGLHLFVEKPMALTVRDGVAMERACDERRLVLMVGHEMRRLGSSRAMKKLIEARELGRLAAATATFTLPGTFLPGDWRSDRGTNRGGALMQLGIHHIETLIYLLGPVASVQGAFSHALAPFDVDDVGAAHLRFESGALATVTATYVTPTSYELHLYGDQANLHAVADMRVWPRADEADASTTLTLQSRSDRRPIPVDPQDSLALQLDEFARSIRGNTTPETGASEGLAALAVVEAALQSAELGSAVDPRVLLADARRLYQENDEPR